MQFKYSSNPGSFRSEKMDDNILDSSSQSEQLTDFWNQSSRLLNYFLVYMANSVHRHLNDGFFICVVLSGYILSIQFKISASVVIFFKSLGCGQLEIIGKSETYRSIIRHVSWLLRISWNASVVLNRMTMNCNVVPSQFYEATWTVEPS